jgi:hypothetical protein
MPPTKIPANFAEIAHLPNKQLVAMLGVAEKTISCARTRLGISKKGGRTPEVRVPDGFAARAGRVPDRTVGAEFGVSIATALRWRKALGISKYRRPKAEKPAKAKLLPRGGSLGHPVPDDFTRLAPTLNLMALAKHYGRDRKTIYRWAKLTGVYPKMHRRDPRQMAHRPPEQRVSRRPGRARKPVEFARTKPVAGRMVLPAAPRQAPQRAGREEEAAQHLRRHYPIVCRCNERGGADQKGELWLVGSAVLTPAEMLERAKRKGFDPEIWRRIAT